MKSLLVTIDCMVCNVYVWEGLLYFLVQTVPNSQCGLQCFIYITCKYTPYLIPNFLVDCVFWCASWNGDESPICVEMTGHSGRYPLLIWYECGQNYSENIRFMCLLTSSMFTISIRYLPHERATRQHCVTCTWWCKCSLTWMLTLFSISSMLKWSP